MDNSASFDSKFYLATLRTARSVGMAVIPMWKCAWLMAILHTFGNNEGFTLSPKFKCDCIYIKETFHIDGAEVPDAEFIEQLKHYLQKCEAVKTKDDPFFQECYDLIMSRYNFKLYC